MPIIIETFEEFSQRQGCEHFVLRDRVLFANGAQSDGRHHHGDPPSDAETFKQLQHEFLSEKLKRSIRKYTEDRNGIAMQAQYHAMGAGPMPPDGWKEYLKNQIEEIEALQLRVSQLTSTLAVHKRQQQTDMVRGQERSDASQALSVLNGLPNF